MIKKGEEVLVEILELNSEGKGVSKLDNGFVIFSSGTLPGDEALVKITKKKSSYAEAKLIQLERKSFFRIKPECIYFGVCGGCKIQNLEYNEQIKFKTNVVKNAFQRIGGFKNLLVPDATKSDEIFYYRNKMEFSFSDDEWLTIPPNPPLQGGNDKFNSFEKDQELIPRDPPLQGGNDKVSEDSQNSILQGGNDIEIENSESPPYKVGQGGFALGLHVPRFHSKIITIEKCFLQSEISNAILNFTREFFKSKNISVYSSNTQSGFLRFLIIRQSKNTNDLMINLITYDYNPELIKEYSEQLKNKFNYITTIINSVSQKKAQVATGEEENILLGNGFITEKLTTTTGKEIIFKISPRSFFQTNTLQAEKLFKVLVEFGEFKQSDTVLDLYCGAGSISIFISDLVNKVFGVELVDDAINDAMNNANLNNIGNVEFIRSDIKDYLENQNIISNYNKLILDPPRSGLHPKICEILSGTNFEKIIYVSCNPHTQARDLQIICGKENYIIEKIQPVDMFPHTYHIENVVSLIKK
ncbi:MAG: 23S rRNA (uracil(1939)-C(5))-methyltransferase RlmD [bacterium]